MSNNSSNCNDCESCDENCPQCDNFNRLFSLKKNLEKLPTRENSNMSDIVNAPSHYISDKGIETIDVIEAFTKDLNPFEAYCTGNIIKYICRWKHKNGLEDLEKARWYINRLLNDSDENVKAS